MPSPRKTSPSPSLSACTSLANERSAMSCPPGFVDGTLAELKREFAPLRLNPAALPADQMTQGISGGNGCTGANVLHFSRLRTGSLRVPHAGRPAGLHALFVPIHGADYYRAALVPGAPVQHRGRVGAGGDPLLFDPRA